MIPYVHNPDPFDTFKVKCSDGTYRAFSDYISSMTDKIMRAISDQMEDFLHSHWQLHETHGLVKYPLECNVFEEVGSGRFKMKCSQLVAMVPVVLTKDPNFRMTPEQAMAEWPHAVLRV